jgi:hypothetical protein
MSAVASVPAQTYSSIIRTLRMNTNHLVLAVALYSSAAVAHERIYVSVCMYLWAACSPVYGMLYNCLSTVNLLTVNYR